MTCAVQLIDFDTIDINDYDYDAMKKLDAISLSYRQLTGTCRKWCKETLTSIPHISVDDTIIQLSFANNDDYVMFALKWL